MLTKFKIAMLATLAAATVAVPTIADAAPLPTWYGRYVWEENLGRIGGDGRDGIIAFSTYTLTLGPSAGDTGCMLRGEGYQLNARIPCTATPEIDSVVIKAYVFNRPSRYYSGQPLFRMTRTNRGLVTRLQALRPSSDATAPIGRLFRPL